MFVNPQGYLYLSGVSSGQTISLDVAIGSTRGGAAGAVKEVYFSSGSAGIYRFSGKVGETITARWAYDSATDGASSGASDSTSYDSSFDVYWLRQQNFTNSASNNPIAISTAPQLAALAWAVNNGVQGADTAYYKLTKNIDLGSFDWTPIGTELNPFKGAFDGAGLTIKNMRLDGKIEDVTAYGLFGYTKSATITNFTMTRDSFNHGSHSKTVKVNGVSASDTTSSGDFNNLTRNIVKVDVVSGNVYAGAAVGYAVDTQISVITVKGLDVTAITNDASATVAVGGVVGYAVNANGAKDYANLTVIGGGTSGTGVGNITDSGLAGATGGALTYAGGVAGYLQNINLIDAALTNVPVWAKGDGHGFGLMRVDRLVAKHGGYLKRRDEDGAFSTEILLPL